MLLTRAEAENDWDGIDSLDNLMLSKLPGFVLTDHLEAQERVSPLFMTFCRGTVYSKTCHQLKLNKKSDFFGV